MYIFIRICVVCAFFAVAFAKIPSYIKLCKRKDPEINKCMVNSIENLRNKLVTGIPEIDLPSIEPLVLKHVQLLRDLQSTKLDINLTNIQVFGPSTFEIRDFNIDPEKADLTFKVYIKKLDFRGKYKINAKILLLNLIGDGDLNGTFLGYEFDGSMRSHKVIRNNNTYIYYEKMKLNDMKINKAMINFDNLFDGDPVLGPASNTILNMNSDLLINELNPVLEKAISDLFTEISNKITKKFTYDELLPNN